MYCLSIKCEKKMNEDYMTLTKIPIVLLSISLWVGVSNYPWALIFNFYEEQIWCENSTNFFFPIQPSAWDIKTNTLKYSYIRQIKFLEILKCFFMTLHSFDSREDLPRSVLIIIFLLLPSIYAFSILGGDPQSVQ